MIVPTTGPQQPPAAPTPVATAGFDTPERADATPRAQPRAAAALATAARRLTPPQDAWPRVFPGL